MIGSIFFVLTLIFYFGLVMANASKPPSGGDAVMGYGLGMAFLGIGFALSSGIMLFSLTSRGAFEWVAKQPAQTMLILTGWVMASVATFFCAILRWEPDASFMRIANWAAQARAYVWLPLLLLVPCLFLLSKNMQAHVAPVVYQTLLKTLFVISAVICLSLLKGWLGIKAAESESIVNEQSERDAALHQEHLNHIAKQTDKDPIVNIIALTGRYHDRDVRDAAVAKITAKPDWEKELMDMLQNKHYFYHAYTFLDAHVLENPSQYLPAISKSLELMAAEIHNNIKDSNGLQDWHFDYLSIDRLLRAIDEQFGGLGTDFRPALYKVLEAFDTPQPEYYPKVKLIERRKLAKWLDERR